MRQVRRGWQSLLLSVALLLTACGGEGDVALVPQAGDQAPEPEIASGTLVESGDMDPLDLAIADIVNKMLESSTSTAELLADLPQELDATALSVINKLRSKVAWNRDHPWTVGHEVPELGQRRSCPTDALSWRYGVAVEVHSLGLPEAVAKLYTDGDDFGPLLTSKAECLQAVRKGGHLLDSHGTVVLRQGETARLASGWTRARLMFADAGGRAERDRSVDVFSGLRVAVSAHAAADEVGAWTLGVFASCGHLEDETGVELDVKEIGQSIRSWYPQRHNGGRRLKLAADERCWMVRLPGYSFLAGSSDAPEVQVLVCARVVDLE